MRTELTQVFEITSECQGIEFVLCFCEMVVVDRGRLRLGNPFIPVHYYFDMGSITSRDGIKIDHVLPLGKYDYREIPLQPWMQFRFEDVRWAVEVCKEMSQPLPESGFGRL